MTESSPCLLSTDGLCHISAALPEVAAQVQSSLWCVSSEGKPSSVMHGGCAGSLSDRRAPSAAGKEAIQWKGVRGRSDSC